MILSAGGKSSALANVVKAIKKLQVTLKGSHTSVAELRDGTLLTEVAYERQVKNSHQRSEVLNHVNVEIGEHVT